MPERGGDAAGGEERQHGNGGEPFVFKAVFFIHIVYVQHIRAGAEKHPEPEKELVILTQERKRSEGIQRVIFPTERQHAAVAKSGDQPTEAKLFVE